MTRKRLRMNGGGVIKSGPGVRKIGLGHNIVGFGIRSKQTLCRGKIAKFDHRGVLRGSVYTKCALKWGPHMDWKIRSCHRDVVKRKGLGRGPQKAS